ncbi:MMPL family transporter [Streptomyces olivaceiscleroticus]|uniref:MMPL family transporter n=1 Tax=Streptomyces olivaceiscleroticus TaxID=68245 RepID=A0ABN0ZEQ8_9ACTN
MDRRARRGRATSAAHRRGPGHDRRWPGRRGGRRDGTDGTPRSTTVRALGHLWWTTHDPALRSRDGTAALVLLTLRGDENQRVRSAGTLVRDLGDRYGSLTLAVSGPAAAEAETLEQVRRDAQRSELLTAPVALLLLAAVFGSFLGGLLPLAVGLVAVLGTLGVLGLLTRVTQVSLLTDNFTTALGFGLALDYSLFYVSRYQEERRNGHDGPQAIRLAAATAGHTVYFSAVTVACCATALLCFPLYFLRSMAIACSCVALVAAAACLLVLPALLSVLGDRLVAASRGRRPARDEGAMWARLAAAIRRRPGWWGASALLLILLLALPARHAAFQLADDQALAPTSPAHLAAERVQDDFAGAVPTVTVALPGLDPRQRSADITGYAQALSHVHGVRAVRSAAGTHRSGSREPPPTGAGMRYTASAGTWLEVSPAPGVTPYSAAARKLVREVRAVPAPVDGRLVGGPSAVFTDTLGALRTGLPAAVAVLTSSMALLVFAYTRSVLVPLKTIAVSFLSLTAVAGIMVAVFQRGELQWLLGSYNTTGRMEMSTPLLVLFLAFALSMDYEIFLLARVREVYRQTGDPDRAVSEGLRHTGRLITLAAGVLTFTVALLILSPLTVAKLFGFSLAAALVLDAAVVRSVLVPSVIHLAGRYTWWGPGTTGASRRSPRSTGR